MRVPSCSSVATCWSSRSLLTTSPNGLAAHWAINSTSPTYDNEVHEEMHVELRVLDSAQPDFARPSSIYIFVSARARPPRRLGEFCRISVVINPLPAREMRSRERARVQFCRDRPREGTRTRRAILAPPRVLPTGPAALQLGYGPVKGSHTSSLSRLDVRPAHRRLEWAPSGTVGDVPSPYGEVRARGRQSVEPASLRVLCVWYGSGY